MIVLGALMMDSNVVISLICPHPLTSMESTARGSTGTTNNVTEPVKIAGTIPNYAAQMQIALTLNKSFLKVGQGGHAPAILDSLAMVWYVLRKKLVSNLQNSLSKLILKSFCPLSLSVCLKDQ